MAISMTREAARAKRPLSSDAAAPKQRQNLAFDTGFATIEAYILGENSPIIIAVSVRRLGRFQAALSFREYECLTRHSPLTVPGTRHSARCAI
jgi:hypothetical protein